MRKFRYAKWSTQFRWTIPVGIKIERVLLQRAYDTGQFYDRDVIIFRHVCYLVKNLPDMYEDQVIGNSYNVVILRPISNIKYFKKVL